MEWWKVIRIITVPSDKRHHCGLNRILFSPSQSFLVGRAEELSELGRRERSYSEMRRDLCAKYAWGHSNVTLGTG